MTRMLFVLCALTLFGAGRPSAQTAPRLVPYVGTLELGDGARDADVRFSLYDGGGEGARRIWGPEEHRLALADGRFSVVLGAQQDHPLNDAALAPASGQTWLEIAVLQRGRWVTLRPRQRLLSVPYAIEAEEAALRAQVARLETIASRRLFLGDPMANIEVRLGPSPDGWSLVEAVPALSFEAPVSGTWRVRLRLLATTEAAPTGQNVRIATDARGAEVRTWSNAASGAVSEAAGRYSVLEPELLVRLVAGQRYRFWCEYMSSWDTERLTRGTGAARIIAELVEADPLP